jgi:geranylgeranyl pyrophosphate synthase
MSKEEYDSLMIETSKDIGPYILEFLEPLKKENSELFSLCSELLVKKIGSFETRAYLMRMCYQICSNKKWNDSIKYACAAVELELASMYYSNRIFDEKGGSKILSQPNNQFIAAMITRDLASQALTKSCKNLDDKAVRKIKNIFDEINRIFYIGQFYEIYYALYEKQSKNIDWDTLHELYYKRNWGVNNSFFEKIAIIGATLGKGNEKQIGALGNFGKNYGMMLQIINDVGDFVPPEDNLGTEEKLPEDAYSDVKHGKLTLPIIYCLLKGSEADKKLLISALTNKNTERHTLRDITRILVNNGSIDYSEKTALEFAKKAKSFLKVFPKNKKSILEEMCFISYTNRYYKKLRKFRCAPK